MDTISITQNSYGAFLRSSSGYLTNSTVTTKCNAIDTNSHLSANGQQYTFVISDNVITPTDGAGITAYDGAIVVAERNTISGVAEGSGFGIRSSFVTANGNTIGPIGGWNGLWIYGESDVSAENNTILNTAKEPVLIGEYHHKDQGGMYHLLLKQDFTLQITSYQTIQGPVIQLKCMVVTSPVLHSTFTCPLQHSWIIR